jgi:putative two-component system response regulator
MMQATILVVDDNRENLTVLGELLRPHYRVLLATSGQSALQLATQGVAPDLILLDVMMPGMSGFQVLTALRNSKTTHDIPVILTTAMCTSDAEEHGLRLGAADYITRPVKPAIVLARVHAHLELKLARDHLKQDKASLECEVGRRAIENQAIEDVAIRALASLAETRDNETGNHILRTQGYVEALARLAAQLPQYAEALNERNASLIAKSAPLHDIGKVGIPDSVLLKPGRLSPEEWAVMKRHSELGAQALERALAHTGVISVLTETPT